MAQCSQRIGPGINNPRLPPTAIYNTEAAFQPIFITGRVQLQGTGDPGQPVAIERVCSGSARMMGFTNSKGDFQLALASNSSFQDASENDMCGGQAAGPRSTTTTTTRRPFDLTGCELRAVLPGYQSSIVMLQMSGNPTKFDAGTIVLKPMQEAPGTTISLTSLGAPPEAMRAFEKAQKIASEQKFAEAEKELEKAVQLYPQFAAAWTLLGDLHSQQKQLVQARAEYTRAMVADPQYLNPCFKLALLSVQEQKWEEAVTMAEQVEKMNPLAYPLVYFYGAAANFNLHRYEAAEDSARKFKSLDTARTHPDVLLLLSMVLEHRLDYAGAAQELRAYLAAVPNAANAEALKERAKRYESLSLAQQVRNPQ